LARTGPSYCRASRLRQGCGHFAVPEEKEDHSEGRLLRPKGNRFKVYICINQIQFISCLSPLSRLQRDIRLNVCLFLAHACICWLRIPRRGGKFAPSSKKSSENSVGETAEHLQSLVGRSFHACNSHTAVAIAISTL